MLKKYRTILEQAEAEIVEKKSRFIATVRPVKTEDEARAFIEEMKKKYCQSRSTGRRYFTISGKTGNYKRKS